MNWQALGQRLLPSSLSGRLMIILCAGLLVAHGLSLGWIMVERARTAREIMLYDLAKDVATSVAVLEQLRPHERPQWLPQFDRRNYRYVLGNLSDGGVFDSAFAQEVSASMSSQLGPRYALLTTLPSEPARRLQIRTQLQDGTPLTIELSPSLAPLSKGIPLLLAVQLLVLGLISWFAVRLATQPLARLAHAANAVTPTGGSMILSEQGPNEVARAAAAFNAMQRRIRAYGSERLQMLASISHDLRTPITRMRLRSDLMEAGSLRDKLQADLDIMQSLVEQGLAYARTAHEVTEPSRPVDLEAFLDTVVCEYVDSGKPVSLRSRPTSGISMRLHTLRRILTNLIDNGLKFGGRVEVVLAPLPERRILIAVQDRGPGIPEPELQRVLQPFYRVESSRNRDTGGAGLGLAIAQQLAQALGGQLTLHNRKGGGLRADLVLPRQA